MINIFKLTDKGFYSKCNSFENSVQYEIVSSFFFDFMLF